MSQGFGEASLKSYESYILERVRKFCSLLVSDEDENGWSLSKNMSDWCKHPLV